MDWNLALDSVSVKPDECSLDEALHVAVTARLRLAGQRYTSGRRAIVEVLAGADHPLAIGELIGRLPTMPRSSAYRHLVVLQAAGVARRVVAYGYSGRFELAETLGRHHHHLHCLVCGVVIDVVLSESADGALRRAAEAVAETEHFRLVEHRLDVVGQCQRCCLI